ncbi:hypothetical protein N665_0367s0001 [Sinapis alba]|nr:hypothetical protein N665_0367s0001 [Sinapis alba]
MMLLFLKLYRSNCNIVQLICFWFLGPDASVDIRWDMTNESDGIYSANVTISNYVMDHEYEEPWKLAKIWVKKETLLGTLGSEGTQHGFVSFSEDDYADTYTYSK